MEELKGKLFRLLKDEIDDLSMGHAYNLKRITLMKEICHLLTYCEYVELDDIDMMKMVRFYD